MQFRISFPLSATWRTFIRPLENIPGAALRWAGTLASRQNHAGRAGDSADLSHLPAWWHERHEIEQFREFARGFAKLDERDQLELMQIVHFLIWLQRRDEGCCEWPAPWVVRGGILYLASKVRQRLAG